MKLSVIVPCYDEEEVITVTHGRLSSVLQDIGLDYEVIYVDDGSKDRTIHLLKEIQQDDMRVRVVRLARNFGHQIAATAGLEHSTGDATVLIDADLQDPPSVIKTFVEKWQEGYHVVYGARTQRPGETHFKLVTAKLFYWLINRLSEVPIPLDTGDFRLMDRRVVDVLRSMPERHRLLRAMTCWVGFRQIAVPYERERRFAGVSKYPLKKMIALALDGIVSFSVVPLKMLLGLGFVMFVGSILGIGYAVLMRIFTENWVPGWTLLFIGVMAMGGLQFISLGILGEYIGRIYSEAKRRPLFVVSEQLGFPVAGVSAPAPAGDRGVQRRNTVRAAAIAIAASKRRMPVT